MFGLLPIRSRFKTFVGWTSTVSLFLFALFGFAKQSDLVIEFLVRIGIPLWLLDLLCIISISIFLLTIVIIIFVFPVIVKIYYWIRRHLAFRLISYSRSNRINLSKMDAYTIDINRAMELRQFRKLRDSNNSKAIILTGPHGVGKSWFAARFSKHYDFWYSFRGPGDGDYEMSASDIRSLLLVCAQWLGRKDFLNEIKSKKEIGQKEINDFCEKLKQRSSRLFFDGVEALLDDKTSVFASREISFFFEKIIKSTSVFRVVITSRVVPYLARKKALDQLGGVSTMQLGGLKPQDGVALLSETRSIPKDNLLQLSNDVEGNPLLLRILRGYALRSAGDGILTNLMGGQAIPMAGASPAPWLEKFSAGGAELVYRLSLVADPVSLESIKVLCGEDLNGAYWARELVDRSLLEFDPRRNTYSLYPTISQLALDVLQKDKRRMHRVLHCAANMYMQMTSKEKPPSEWVSLTDCQATTRALDLYLALREPEKATFLLVDRLHKPLRDWGEWQRLCDYYGILLGLWLNLGRKSYNQMFQFAGALRNYGKILVSMAMYREAVSLLREHQYAVNRIGEQRLICLAISEIGAAYRKLGRIDKAIRCFRKCQKLAQEKEDRPDEANAYYRIGDAHCRKGDAQLAIKNLEKGLELSTATDQERLRGRICACLGRAYHALGEYDRAKKYYEQSLEVARGLGDKAEEVVAYGSLAYSHYSLAQYGKALEFLDKRLAFVEGIGDKRSVAYTLDSKGKNYRGMGEFSRAISLHERALSIDTEIENKLGMSREHYSLGQAYWLLGGYKEAEKHLLDCRRLAKEVGDKRGWADAENMLGKVCRVRGQFKQAIRHHRKSLRKAQEIGDKGLEIETYCQKGIVNQERGLYSRALEHQHRALSIAEAIDNRRREAYAHSNLGTTYYYMSNYPESYRHHILALKNRRKIGDARGQAKSYGNLGLVFTALGKDGVAKKAHEKCLDIAKRISDRRVEGIAYGNLGCVYNAQGHFSESIKYQKRSLKIALGIGDRVKEAEAYANLGSVMTNQGEYREAIELHRKSLRIFKQIGDRRGECVAHANLGRTHHARGHRGWALNYHKKSLKIALEIGDRRSESEAYGNQGITKDAQQKYEEAVKLHKKRLEIAKEIGDPRGVSLAYGGLGNAYLSLGEFSVAENYYRMHLSLAQQIGDRLGEGNANSNLACAHKKLGQTDKALEFAQSALDLQREIGNLRGMAIGNHNIADLQFANGNCSEAVSFGVRGLFLAAKIGMPDIEKDLSLLRNCIKKLGRSQFMKIVVESEGESGAQKINRILSRRKYKHRRKRAS